MLNGLLRIALISALFATCSCESQSTPQSPPEQSREFTSASIAGAVPSVMSVETVLAATQELDGRIAIAISEHIAKCMSDAGFSYNFARPEGPFDDRPIVAQYYGPINPSSAVGYSNDHFNGRFPVEPPPGGRQYRQALYGDEENRAFPDLLEPSRTINATFSNGCLGAARAAIFGSQEDWVRYTSLTIAVGDLVDSAIQLTRADDRFATTVADWSACMSRRGFSYQSPTEPAIADWTARVEQESRVVSADLECKEEVRLVERWDAVFAEHADAGAKQHVGLLEELDVVSDRLDAGLAP